MALVEHPPPFRGSPQPLADVDDEPPGRRVQAHHVSARRARPEEHHRAAVPGVLVPGRAIPGEPLVAVRPLEKQRPRRPQLARSAAHRFIAPGALTAFEPANAGSTRDAAARSWTTPRHRTRKRQEDLPNLPILAGLHSSGRDGRMLIELSGSIPRGGEARRCWPLRCSSVRSRRLWTRRRSSAVGRGRTRSCPGVWAPGQPPDIADASDGAYGVGEVPR